MRLLVAALLLIAALAAAQESGYQEASSSSCWDCHAPGRMENPMAPAFAVDPGVNPLAGEILLQPRIVNTWAAEVSQMTLQIDLSDAPGLSFVGSEPPYHHESRDAVHVDVTNPLFAVQQHHAEMAAWIPAGAGALRIQVVPDDRSALGPDLRLTITDAVSSHAFVTVDGAGAGDAETFLLDDPGAIAAHGAGNWTLDIGLQPAGTDGHLDPNLQQAPFVLLIDAWFNTSAERILVLDAAGPIKPGNAQIFTIPIQADGVTTGQQVTFTSRARIFYEHGDSTPDEAFLQYEESFMVSADASGAPVLGTHAFAAPSPSLSLGLASISEAVGYAAAFLMVASVLSGGILGKGSRRAMNRVFTTARRRVAFHNFLSYGILAAAFAHLIIFLIEIDWHWAWGLLWGGAGIMSLFALGFTGALQVPIIRRWGFRSWRWIHFGFAIAAIGFTVIHVLLDGSHFTVRDAIGWHDPLVPDTRQ